jgi:hypothetical protein
MARLGTDTNQDQKANVADRSTRMRDNRNFNQRRTNAGQECRCCGDPPVIELHQSAVIYTNGTQTVFA